MHNKKICLFTSEACAPPSTIMLSRMILHLIPYQSLSVVEISSTHNENGDAEPAKFS